MRFGAGNLANLFWIIVFLILFLLWVDLKKKKLLNQFAQKNLLIELTKTFDIRKYRIKQILLILGIFFIIVSLLRPQWGFKWQRLQKKGLDILIAVDVSKSMLAQDIKPSRLERTKLALADFIKILKGDRVGLIAFAGDAFLLCPLTCDYNGFLLSAGALDVDIIPKGGTSIFSAIKEAVKGFEVGEKYKVLIIITDGEDHSGALEEAIKLAKKEGIKIFCIGVGTKEGELIPIKDKDGNRTFLKDNNGLVVKSSLNEENLKKLAFATDGSYIHATAKEFGLELLYKEKLSKLEKKDTETKISKQYYERFQIPLLIAFFLLSIEFLINERKANAD
ncbi:MAG: VWA domain-containing protein [Candidatus Omnitrophica bacterium]|nr:VWA domain-containing protein [Candidatus Omnitrophota bacterium]